MRWCFLRIKKVKSDTIKLYETSQVKFKVAGNNNFCPIQNISRDKYIDKATGEIKERKKSVSRYQTPKSVRKSINRLMDLIRCNATEPTHCKWLTLTYADAMTDHTKVYEDGKMFLRRFQRYLNKSEEIFDSQKTFKRITVAESQGEIHGNSWHLHILLIFDEPAPFIENEVIAKLWGHGITDTHKVYDADGKDKKFIKGERLKYYPTGMPLFSASRGMKRPVVEKISNKEAMERVSDCKMVYRETYAIGDENKGNIIDKRYYKKQEAKTS